MNEFWILAVVFVSSFVFGLIGFGDALIFIPLATPFIGIQKAVIIVTIWGFFPTILNLIHYRHNLDKKFIIRGILTGIPGTFIGTLLIAYANLRWVELLLGCFILIYSSVKIYEVLKKRKEIEEEVLIKKEIPELVLIAGGFSYGFFGGLIGASGPINVALLEGTGHYREDLIGNFAAVSFAMVLLKVPMYIATDIFPKDLLLILLLGIPIIFIASKLGHYITPKISVEKFRLIILSILLLVALRSILSNTFFYD